jgi:phospholipid transport system substrate-binding protein
MSFSRRFLLFSTAATLVAPHFAAAADPNSAPGLVEHFYADLLATMKQGKKLSFDERYNRLAPTVTRSFDLGLMTRIAVGPGWGQIAPAQRQRLTTAFSRYTISVYANRFDDYGGERFEVTPTMTANPNGVIVASRLVKANGEDVPLNYLMRQDGTGMWKIIDVYLSGTVSELATRRSEFLSVLQREGAEGLVQMIEKRTAALRAG